MYDNILKETLFTIYVFSMAVGLILVMFVMAAFVAKYIRRILDE